MTHTIAFNEIVGSRRSWLAAAVALLLLLCSSLMRLTAAAPVADPKELPKFPSVAARDALNTFQLRKGFRLELVAAEPLVTEPIALAFDEEGRLFVAEMRDFPEGDKEHHGQVKRLEDTDGDGRFDKATVFADGLRWPSALHCYGGGVFVGAVPDLFFFKDTNDDGVADEKRVVLTGWGNRAGTLDAEGVFGSLAWGLDNQIHGLVNRFAGVITNPNNPSAKPVTLGGNFAFDPRTMTLVAEGGEGQYGMGFNDDGRQFLSRQHRHIMTHLFDRRYADRNPYYTMPDPTVDIAVDGPKAALYRISPEEPWRVMRTKWRVEGLEEGIEAGGRASGYFSAACGLTIYRGNAWPRDYVGDAFVADPAENIVHHKKVMHAGPKASAERPADEQRVEFLASKDTWFRPVHLANAPDGTLYIADMYRQIIEAKGIPDEIVKHLDLSAGRDMRRIYRIVPEGFKQPPLPRLSRASLEELVATLENPNGWHRDTAARLLYERNDRAAAPALTTLLAQSKSPLGRLHAMYALKALQALDERRLLQALSDGDGVVREHAVRLSEGFLQRGVPSPELWKKLVACASDPVIGVRYQLAFTLGEVRHPERLGLLAQIARRDAIERMMRAAILSSLAEGAGEMFGLLADESGSVGPAEMLCDLAAVIGAANQPTDLARVREALISTCEPVIAFALARGLGDGLRRAGSSFEKAGIDLKSLMESAAGLATDIHARDSARLEAITFLAFGPRAESAKTLLPLLNAQQAQAVQLAALTSLDRLSPDGLAAALVNRWSSFTPAIRDRTVDALLKRPDRTGELLTAMEQGIVQRRDLSLMQVVALRQHSDPNLQQRAIKLIGATSKAHRDEVVRRFRPALEMRGDAQRGKAVFQQRCQSCHRLGSDGFAVGPDLAGARTGGKEKLLINILDPNREVPPNYFGYVIETKGGDSHAGLIVNETASSVTIRQPLGIEAAAFDAAIHDAFGKVNGMNCFDTYGPEFMNHDLSHYLGAGYEGRYPSHYLLPQHKPRMTLCHLVSAVDPIEDFENKKPIKDGLPETLPEWINYNRLLELKIKVNGTDLRWDIERVMHIDKVTTQTQEKRGVKDWAYVLDFNEKCPNVDYFIQFCRELKEKMPIGYLRIKYTEQPTARDLKAHPENAMHDAARLCPVVIDESLIDLESLLLARKLGWTGAAVKSPKGLTHMIMTAAVAGKEKIFLCGGDMSCPGAALIQTANLQARVPTITSVEANARQYLPEANKAWESRFPGMFRVTDGMLRTQEVSGLGLGVPEI